VHSRNRSGGNTKLSILSVELDLVQNANRARQFPIIKGAAPFSVRIAVRHALESNALDHEEFNQKRRPGVGSRRYGLAACGQAAYRAPALARC